MEKLIIKKDNIKDLIKENENGEYILEIEDGVQEVECDGYALQDISELIIPDSVVSFKITEYYDFSGNKISDCIESKNIKRIKFSKNQKEIPSCSHCSNLEEVILPEKLKKVPEWAFRHCSRLTRINIPNSVKTIGEYAFFDCELLEKIEMDDNLEEIEAYVFGWCTNLKEIILPLNLKRVGKKAFYRCENLGKIDLPEGVEEISDNVFEGCYSLDEVFIPSTVKKIGKKIFWGCEHLSKLTIPIDVCAGDDVLTVREEMRTDWRLENYKYKIKTDELNLLLPQDSEKIPSLYLRGLSVKKMTIPEGITDMSFVNHYSDPLRELEEIIIPSTAIVGRKEFCNYSQLKVVIFSEGLKVIGKSAFEGCSQLQELVLPNSLESIGDSAFKNCINLRGITMNDAVKTIGSSAFEGCSQLQGLVLPNSLESIGDSAFYNCSKLEKINIPNSLDKIDCGCFINCQSLHSINIPDSITSIESQAFKGCSNIEEIIIPESVSYIGDEAFMECNILRKAVLPERMKQISEGLFFKCVNLEYIELPDAVEGLDNEQTGKNAFYGCKKLDKVVLPRGLKNISKGMFYECIGLKEVVLQDGIETIGAKSFFGCENLENINFPESLIKAQDAFEGCKYSIIQQIPGRCKLDENGGFEEYYREDVQDGVLIIPKGTKVIKSLKYNPEARYSYNYDRPNVSGIIIPDGVIEISAYAISGFSDIEEIIFPDSVLEIGKGNFKDCEGLKNVRLSRKLKKLPYDVYKRLSESNNGITCLIIPESITEITESYYDGYNTGPIVGDKFVYCPLEHSKNKVNLEKKPGKSSSLISVTKDEMCKSYVYCKEEIQESTMDIRGNRFSKTFRMNDVLRADTVNSYTVDGSYKIIGPGAFAQCCELESVELKDGVEVIGPGAFALCSKLKSVTIPKSVKYISPYAFYGCEELDEIEIPGKNVQIDDFAFGCCDSLEEVTLAKNIKRIGIGAFCFCENLKKLYGMESATEIDDYAFAFCRGLHAKVPKSLKRIGNYAYAKVGTEIDLVDTNNEILDNMVNDMVALSNASIKLPKTLESIGEGAFAYCNSFMLVEFEEKIKLQEIKDRTFSHCSLLDTINLPKNLETVGNNAFSNCTNLKVVIFPSSVEKIGENCFENCTNMQYAIFTSKATRNEVMSPSSFNNCPGQIVYEQDWNLNVDKFGRIIGNTNETKPKKYTFEGIKNGIKKRLTSGKQQSELSETVEEQYKENIYVNLGNVSREQLRQICSVLGVDLDNVSFEQLEQISSIMGIGLNKDDDVGEK